MKRSKLSMNFARYRDANLLNKAEGILQSMNSNPVFTDPLPSLAVFETAINDYSIALAEATGLGRNAIAQKRECRQILEKYLRQLGYYVMSKTKCDKTLMISSGFTLTKTPEASYITRPENVILKNGISSGMLITSTRIIKGVRSYIHQIAPDPLIPESKWQSKTTTRSRYTFTNLEPGKKYWARIIVTGRGTQIAYSPLSCKYVQ